MKHPRLLQNDDNILEIWRKHCRKVPIVTIYIRLEIDASPAEERTPSSIASFAARQQLFLINVPDYMVMAEPIKRPAPKISTYPGVHGERSVEMVWTSNETWAERRELQDLRIQIRSGESSFCFIPAKYLLMFIKKQCLKGTPITDIKITFWKFVEEGRAYSNLKLSKEIWEESLLRGPWEELFSVFWMEKAVEQVGMGKGSTIEPPPSTLRDDSRYISQVTEEGTISEDDMQSE